MEDTKTLITVKQAADLLGVCDQTVYFWIHHKGIKAINLTRQLKRERALWRVYLSDVEAKLGLPICPKTLKPITSPAVCIHCKRDCPRAGKGVS